MSHSKAFLNEFERHFGVFDHLTYRHFDADAEVGEFIKYGLGTIEVRTRVSGNLQQVCGGGGRCINGMGCSGHCEYYGRAYDELTGHEDGHQGKYGLQQQPLHL